jgi:hypothetical protein
VAAAWRRLMALLSLPREIGDLPWESDNRAEAIEKLGKLTRFYDDVGIVVRFLISILNIDVRTDRRD